MDISLFIAHICLHICMYFAEICMDIFTSSAIHFDLGLSFCFMLYRRRHFEKRYKKSQKLSIFYHKIKTRYRTGNLRHVSLD